MHVVILTFEGFNERAMAHVAPYLAPEKVEA